MADLALLNSELNSLLGGYKAAGSNNANLNTSGDKSEGNHSKEQTNSFSDQLQAIQQPSTETEHLAPTHSPAASVSPDSSAYNPLQPVKLRDEAALSNNQRSPNKKRQRR